MCTIDSNKKMYTNKFVNECMPELHNFYGSKLHLTINIKLEFSQFRQRNEITAA